MSDDLDGYRLETQLALIRQQMTTMHAENKRDVQEISRALYGDRERGEKGLVQIVEDLVRVADRGCFSLRVALWCGGGIITAATALNQLKTSIQGILGIHP